MSSTEQNKAVVRRFYDEVVTQGRIDELDHLASDDIVDHAARRFGLPGGRAGFTQHVAGLRAGVADASVTIDDLVAEDDRVVAFWTLRGIHVGLFFGVQATGLTFAGRAISTLRISGGRIVEYDVQPDVHALLQQLRPDTR